MKLKQKKSAVIAAGFILAVIPIVMYLARSPVLIVADQTSLLLCGETQIRTETFDASLSLFRRVKTIPIADDAGDDIIRFAVTEASSRPFCVLFPLRFAQAARVYREQNPSVPTVILEGRFPEGANPASLAGIVSGGDVGDYFLYKTDIEADFYRAALAASLLDREKNGQIVVFLESHIQTQAREAFRRALEDTEKPLKTQFLDSFSRFSNSDDISCVVIAGAGYEYLDKYKDVPVIFFSWIDPRFIPIDTALVLNDSPWAQTAEAARMVKTGITQGKIKSKINVLFGNNIEKSTLRALRKI